MYRDIQKKTVFSILCGYSWNLNGDLHCFLNPASNLPDLARLSVRPAPTLCVVFDTTIRNLDPETDAAGRAAPAHGGIDLRRRPVPI